MKRCFMFPSFTVVPFPRCKRRADGFGGGGGGGDCGNDADCDAAD